MPRFHRFILDEDHRSLAIELPLSEYGPNPKSERIRHYLPLIKEKEGMPHSTITYLGTVERSE